jgi:Protein of unknown function (DUF3558)
MRSVVNRRLAVLPLFAAAVFGLAACNSTTTGTGTAAPTGGSGGGGGTQTSTDAGGSTPSSSSGGSGLAALQPCDLITASALTQYQLSKTGSGNEEDARTCTWQKSVDVNGDGGYTTGVDIRENEGLSDVVSSGYTVTDDQVGSHQGKQLQATGGGTCAVAIGVTSKSRVDVHVSGAGDTSQMCQLANNLAKVVEPQLPAGGN